MLVYCRKAIHCVYNNLGDEMDKIITNSKVVVRPTDELQQKVEADLKVPDPSRAVAKAIVEDALEQEKDDECEEETKQD